MSARKYDGNGFFEVARNPISKVGVFPYMGDSIGAPVPNKLYMVYRPAEELGAPECLDSFRLAPFVDDHEMLGEGEGLTPAEQKGVHGVIGDNVVFDGKTLWGNLKIFSSDLAKKLKGGKREVSAGYRCEYDFTSGIFDGIAYDAIQRKVRGNHLALVNKGRMGPDVAVLDNMAFTIDAAEDLHRMDQTAVDAALAALTAGQTALTAQIQTVADSVAALVAAKGEETTPGEDSKVAPDAEADKMKGGEGADAVAALQKLVTDQTAEIAVLKDRKGLDMADVLAEISQRDALAERLKPHVGSFDHSAMSLNGVAKYGLEKVGLKATEGHEVTALDAYLQAKPDPSRAATVDAEDKAPAESFVTRYLTPAQA